jgi:hypothetical protein
MSEGEVDWLQPLAVEEEVGKMDALPPDLNRLTECVCLIADALKKEVKINVWHNDSGPVRSFRYSGNKLAHSQDVRVQSGRYFIAHQIAADLFHAEETSTARLAWSILGFINTPAAFRAALDKKRTSNA